MALVVCCGGGGGGVGGGDCWWFVVVLFGALGGVLDRATRVTDLVFHVAGS